MTGNPSPAVLISEVGPRDGLQSVKAVMPTAGKRRWIGALYAAGLGESAGEPGYGMTPQAGLPKGFVHGSLHG